MALDIKKLKAEVESNIKFINDYIEKPNDWREIKIAARDYRNRWLEKANTVINEDGTSKQKSNPRKTLNELAVAQGMEYILHIVTLDNGRIAIYDPDNGFYHKDAFYAYKIIRLLEPTFNKTKSDNVLFMLSTVERKHQYNGFSSNFPVGEYKDPRRFIVVKNGIYDKKTNTLSGFTHEFVAFSTIATEYDKFAKSPTIDGWEVDSWLLDLMSGDRELFNLLWQVIAASLNGNYSYRKSIWLVGNGNDGKGTFQQLITNIVGITNVATLKLNQFADRFSLSVIEGKTVIIGDDVQAGIYVDESSNFNSVVTGEPVLVEEKNKQPYTTIFRKTVIQSTNELPKFKNKTNGTYRRFLIIPFNKTFSTEDDNWAIKDDYINRDEVKEYVLKKALELNFERFDEPKATKVLMEEFKESNDTVALFVKEWFDHFESTRLPVRFLWWLYQNWCKEEGMISLTKRKFEQQLAQNIPGGWEKVRLKPTNKFIPSIDCPKRYMQFVWEDTEWQKATVLFKKSY